jgi:hypothetical protein
VPHVPPDFLSRLVALANVMRPSFQKAAHANLADAAYRKSGPHQRTWDEKDGAQPLQRCCYAGEEGVAEGENSLIPVVKAFEKSFSAHVRWCEHGAPIGGGQERKSAAGRAARLLQSSMAFLMAAGARLLQRIL